MTHRQEMILAKCQLALTLTNRPQLFEGESVLVQGLMGTDYNLLLQDLFRSAVGTAPNEDYEDNTLVVYMTRSAATHGKMCVFAEHNRAPSVDVYVDTYTTFDPDEILDKLADLEDGTRTCRYLIIEDTASSIHQGTPEQIRRLRNAVAPHGVLLITSSSMNNLANETMRTVVDSNDWLPLVSTFGYERHRGIDREYDIVFIAAPGRYDVEAQAVTMGVVACKCRGALPVYRTIVESSYTFAEL